MGKLRNLIQVSFRYIPMKQVKTIKISTVGQRFRRHQQAYIYVYAVYLNYARSNLKHQPKHNNNIHVLAEISFIIIKYNS